jgi:hypothetical protein
MTFRKYKNDGNTIQQQCQIKKNLTVEKEFSSNLNHT